MSLSNPWAAFPLVAGLISLVTGVWVFLRYREAPVYRYFLAFCLLMAAGNLGNTLALLSPDREGHLLWVKVGWLFYMAALGAYAQFTFAVPRPRVPLSGSDHPWARRLPRAMLRLDRRILETPRLPLLLFYLPAAATLFLWMLPEDLWLLTVREVFFGHVAIFKSTWANLPWIVLVVIGLTYGGSNIFAGYLNFPEKRRVTRFLFLLSEVTLVYLVLFFISPLFSLRFHGLLIFLTYLGTAGVALFFALAVVKYGLLVSPVDEARSPHEPKYALTRGDCFLVQEEKPDFALRVFADLVTHGAQGLGLTRTSPPEIRAAHGLPRTPLVWVGRIAPAPDIQAVDYPEGLSLLVDEFLTSTPEGVILLDALEYLAEKHGSPLTLQLLYSLRETVAQRGGRLILSVNPRALPERELSLLQKEMKTLTE
ncbi:MAG: DUF835 domain-containing protein [Euryarchaeota archaeon]|nr:DUF835 domain-containing protein [Euryarchaeota archaeon]